ncbi:hypothetical protein KR044_008993 [Drosophila immigrans]|nr:hypothetical protein KR044_008993 [Drosophila immigrans]
MWRSLLGLFLLCPLVVVSGAEKICGSLELRQLSDFQQLRSCDVVVGHVHIANLQLPSNFKISDLQCNVTEITDYLLIYHTRGLLTAEYIFPKLRLIRGQQLLFDQHAFVVYDNHNLRELGLLHLLRIQRGSIRIENNPMLCFVDTVDWIYLLGNSSQQHFTIKGNKSPNHCPVCGGLSADYTYRSKGNRNCWNLKAPQRKWIAPKTEGCPVACGRFGCELNGTCCDRNCITGCSIQSCSLCANYMRNGRCVDQCVASYELNKRQCISVKDCRQRKLIPLTQGYRCVDHCPKNQKTVVDANGRSCQLECKGVYHVKRAADLEHLRDCLTIEGSLIIELVDIKEKIVSELEQALGSIKEITGYLKVIHSTPLMSLTFLRNLDTIRGDKLIENKYALFVVNNYHLEHLWPTNRQVAIQRGTIFFHLNPRLCYDKIESLMPSLKNTKSEISVADVSRNSNGERVICGDSVTKLEPQIQDINSTAVSIMLDFMIYDNVETLLGYSYHYMEAPKRNVTMYDGRHGCGHDNWLMDVSRGKSRRFLISNLKPYTQYAYFVKTITRLDYHMNIDAYSTIQYFRTLPSKPSPVRRLYGITDYVSQIMVHWWPPHRPNGNISHYLLNFELHNLTQAENSTKNYATVKPFNNLDAADCECNDLQPFYSGPQPEVEQYYNRAQTTYEEALPDLIYVRRRRLAKKKEKFGRVVSFEHLDDERPTEDAVETNTTTTANATTAVTATDSTTVVATNSTQAAATNATTVVATNATTIAATNATVVATNATAVNGSLAGNATATNQTVVDDSAEQYERYRQYVEDQARNIQDLEPEKFIIQHDPPKCKTDDASVANQIEQKCIAEEDLSESIKVPGTQQYYNLTNLLPSQYYRITVRACVDGVVNGCSQPAVLLVETRGVETFNEIF